MPAESLSRTFFPFSAVCGMEEAKKALMCALISKNIKSVLIRGPAGAAKTTLVRSIPGSISSQRLINIPLNVTEEQLFGGMCLEGTIQNGKIEEREGLLQRADGHIAYIDDVNFFDSDLLTSVLNSLETGKLVVEREGVSAVHDLNCLLICTMNPEDSDLSAHVLDRFDICVCLSENNEIREEVLRRNMAFSLDPSGFVSYYSDEDRKMQDMVINAEKLLPYVTISDDLISIITELCVKIGAHGHRGDMAVVHTALALASLNGRDEVTRKDVEEAALLCLPHRRDYTPPPEPPRNNEPPEQPPENDQQEEQNPENNQQEEQNPEDQDDGSEKEEQEMPSLDDMMFQIGQEFKVIDYIGEGKVRISKSRSRKGRRNITESGDLSGRYVRYRIPSGSTRDIAFDATIRAAAPYQKSRNREDLTIAIEPSDLREKIRERRCGCTLLFLVDASGSLGVRKRMTAVKGAILSMLKDSYIKRDRVGMMAFRRDGAELILPPTRSVEYSYRQLEDLPTGGKTPLSTALVKVSEFMNSYARSHAGEKCYIILLTDGRANVPMHSGSDANSEALKLAEDLKIPGINWIVIDTSVGYMRFDNAQRLAENLSGVYFRLEDLNSESLAANIKSVVDQRRS